MTGEAKLLTVQRLIDEREQLDTQLKVLHTKVVSVRQSRALLNKLIAQYGRFENGNGVGQFACGTCPRSFATAVGLTRHQRVHGQAPRRVAQGRSKK